MTSPIKSVGSFFQHAFALPGSGSPGPATNIPQTPPAAPPAMLPSAKPSKKTAQQSFFSGAAMAQQAGMGPNQGKTLIGG